MHLCTTGEGFTSRGNSKAAVESLTAARAEKISHPSRHDLVARACGNTLGLRKEIPGTSGNAMLSPLAGLLQQLRKAGSGFQNFLLCRRSQTLDKRWRPRSPEGKLP